MSNSGLQIQPKPIIGLRSTDVHDEFTNMFSDSSDDHTTIQIKPINPLPSYKGRTGSAALKLQPVTSYSQISSHINSLCTALGKYERPPECDEPMDFIPQKMTPKNIVDSLKDFYKTKDYKKFKKVIDSVDSDNLQTSILIQINLISHKYDSSVDLGIYANNEMEPRLSCLFHWYFATIVDKPLACSHYMKSLLDFVKCSSMIPISRFFPEFNLDEVLFKFCETLITLFYKHPLIVSVIERLATLSKIGDKIRAIPIPEDTTTLDDDSSSDEFSDLKLLQRNKSCVESSMSLIKLNDHDVVNPLENLTNTTDPVVVSLDDSPTTITYQLEDGTSRMTPDDFQKWVKSFSYPPDKQPKPSEIDKIYKEPVLKEIPHNLSKIEIDDIMEKMYTEDVRPRIPQTTNANNALHILPALHFINSNSADFFGNSAPDPNMLKQEFLCHKAFYPSNKSNNNIKTTLEYFVNNIPPNLEVSDINLSMTLRKLPDQEFIFSDYTKVLLNLIDISLIMEMRSPLTLLPATSTYQIDQKTIPNFYKKIERFGPLYHLYSNYRFPPYVTFRAAFALGITIMEKKPQVAASFLFEGLYVLLRSYPSLGKSVWAYAAFYALGEALEQCGKYNYCAICLDNALPLTLASHSFASKAGKIAKKNEDLQRAIFYFSNSIGLFLDAQLPQEAIFTSQLLARIYEGCGQYIEGIQLLAYMLKDVYSISSQREKRRSTRIEQNVQKKRMATVQSSVNPDSIESIISGILLCELFLKVNQFNQAENLLSEISQSRYVTNSTLSKHIYYLKEKIAIEKNTFTSISFRSDSKSRKHQPLIVMPQSQISDPTLPLLKILAKSYISKNDPEMALFWSEMICHAARQLFSPRESAIGFFLRGVAFKIFMKEIHKRETEFVITKKLTEAEETFGFFKGQRKFTRKDIIAEALASFNYAMILFDRAGNSEKTLETQIEYIETIFEIILDDNSFKRTSIHEITYKKPALETESADIGNGQINLTQSQLAIAFESLTLSSSNIIEHLQAQVHAIDKLVRTLMDPLLIIRSQLCLSMFMQFRKKQKPAETYYDYALSNIRKIFFNNQRFVMRDVGFYPGWQIYNTVQLLLRHLLTFSTEFINHRLIVFDMYNDIQAFYTNQHRLVAFNPPIKFEATLQVQPSILKLGNQRFPDFAPYLKDYCNITEEQYKNYISKRWELWCMFRLNRANIKNFRQHRLSDVQVYEHNKNICIQMEQIADQIRKQNQTIMTNELPPHSLDTTLFIVNFPGKLVTYIPENGQKKTIQLTVGESDSFQIESLRCTYQFDSNVFKKSFLEAIANLILSQPCVTPKFKFGSKFANECVKFANFLFGEIPFLKDLEESNETEKDSSTFGDKTPLSYSRRGELSVININKRPLVIVSSTKLNFFPYELMFPNCTVIRTNGFFKAFSRENSNKLIQRCAILKWRTDRDKLSVISDVRSDELIRSTLSTLTAAPSEDVKVADFERSFPFPFALFDPMRDTEKYAQQFPFCDIFPIKPGVIPELFMSASPLFVLSYADLAEWPALIDTLVDEIPTATFLFIPATHIQQAFKELAFIFERHAKRQAYLEKKPSDPDIQKQNRLIKNSFQILGTIQKTLMSKLKVPIGIICPTKDFNE